MPDEVQKEISFPIIPESIDEGMKSYLLRIQEILREVSLGASRFSAVTLQEFSTDGDGFKDEDDMASDSAKSVPSQQSVKKYVDDEAAAAEAAAKTYADDQNTAQFASGGAIESAFGDWNDKDSENATLVKSEVYKAGSDGFVVCEATTSASNQTVAGYTDSVDASTIRIASAFGDATVNNIMGVTMPVKKNDYWKILFANTVRIYWLPIGSGTCVKQ